MKKLPFMMGLSDTSPHYTGFLSASLLPAAAAAGQCTHLPDTEHFQGRLPASIKNPACNVQAYRVSQKKCLIVIFL